ncbi:MAG: SCO family protein [bacterium]
MKRFMIVALLVVFVVGCGSTPRETKKAGTSSEGTTEVNSIDDKANPAEPGSLVGKDVSDLPDTGIVNQEGESVSIRDYQGRPVVMSFIFSRCPMKKMCPLITQKMVRVQNRLKQQKIRDVQFVSVSFDPEYDTPAVLKDYGKRYNPDYRRWDFWTGSKGTIERILDRFKIMVRRKKNGLPVSHNLRTYVLDESGTVRYWYRSSDWKVSNVVSRVKQVLESPSE